MADHVEAFVTTLERSEPTIAESGACTDAPAGLFFGTDVVPGAVTLLDADGLKVQVANLAAPPDVELARPNWHPALARR